MAGEGGGGKTGEGIPKLACTSTLPRLRPPTLLPIHQAPRLPNHLRLRPHSSSKSTRRSSATISTGPPGPKRKTSTSGSKTRRSGRAPPAPSMEASTYFGCDAPALSPCSIAPTPRPWVNSMPWLLTQAPYLRPSQDMDNVALYHPCDITGLRPHDQYDLLLKVTTPTRYRP